MIANPNWFAYLALFAWPLVTVGLYRRMPVGKATIWSILGGYLILPVGTSVDLPMIPPLNKDVIPNLSAFLVCRFMLGRKVPLLPGTGLERWLAVGFVVSTFITSLLNSDSYDVGPIHLPGLTAYDALSDSIRQWLYILPFLMARKFLNTSEGCEQILTALMVAGLAYSLPILLEIRLSPQLHKWIYGFFPHLLFSQEMRAGGFRPVVFLGHGLWVAFFIMNSLIAAVALWRLRRRVWQVGTGAATLYLGVILLLCKSLASILYGIGGFLIAKVMSPKAQISIAGMLTVIVLIYPVLRDSEMLPLDWVTSQVEEFSKERAHSLQVRLHDEESILMHIHERPFFGWGGWNRNGVYDPITGKGSSGADGRWILVLGKYGWAGYITEFLLVALPVLRVAKSFRKVNDYRDRVVLSSLCLILAITLFDCIPNAPVRPLTWLLAGAVSGYLSTQVKLVAGASKRSAVQGKTA
ncbi:MAG: hypothetical protein ACU836_02730 [Gammaproteobacteria bacterium]